MQPNEPIPVKYFIGALFSKQDLLDKAITIAEQHFGTTELASAKFTFDQTNYYNQEMSSPIQRQFFAFSKLLPPGCLAQAKLTTNSIEDQLRIEGHRKVNLDIGYLDYDKVVLASAKYGIHKVYLSCGIYADLALHYSKGHFQPYPWTFLDFKSGSYEQFFLTLRTNYKKQLAALRQNSII